MDSDYIKVSRSQFKAKLRSTLLLSLFTGLWVAMILVGVLPNSFLSSVPLLFHAACFSILALLWLQLFRSFEHILKNSLEENAHLQEESKKSSLLNEEIKLKNFSKKFEDFVSCRHEKFIQTLRELHLLITSHLNDVTNETDKAALSLIDQLKLIHDATTSLMAKVTENRKESDQIAAGSQSTLVDNQETMNRLQVYIDNRLQDIDRDYQMASELQKQAVVVSDLTKLIESVTKQTTIVATNAQIEAARAGVQGQAFSVIADEVGKLSAQIGDSVKQIIHSIDQMGKNIEEKFKLKLDRAAQTEESSLLNNLKDQLTLICNNYSRLEAFNSQTLADINSSSEHIKSKVNDSLMAIQFQDITQQQIEVILKSLRLFESYLSDQSCVNLASENDPRYREFDIEKIRKLYVMKKQHDIHNDRHQYHQLKPNQQDRKEAGDITLF